jgi:hypothetical protein
MLQTKSSVDTNTPMHIYYDIDLINNPETQNSEPVKLIYNDIRTSSFIKHPKDYFMSIVRFSLNCTTNIPIFIPQVELGQTNPNRTIYEIISENNITSTVLKSRINFLPTGGIPVPQPPLTVQDLTNDYYFVNTYQSWINMLNATLIAITPPTFASPFFSLERGSSKLNLYVPTTWLNTINIYINQPLYNLLEGFPITSKLTNNTTLGVNGMVLQLLVGNINGLNTQTINSVPYYVMYQEYCTLSRLNPVQSIVFTTSLLPVQPALTQPAKIFNQTSDFTNSGNNSNITPIITDFQINVDNNNLYKPSIQYTPAVYRLIDLVGDGEVNAMQISAFWKDNFGGLHNILMDIGTCANIKFMFRRKDFNMTGLY